MQTPPGPFGLSPSCSEPGVQHCSKQLQSGGVPCGHTGAGGGAGGEGEGVAEEVVVDTVCPCATVAHRAKNSRAALHVPSRDPLRGVDILLTVFMKGGCYHLSHEPSHEPEQKLLCMFVAGFVV